MAKSFNVTGACNPARHYMVAIMPPAAAQMMMKADIFSLLVPINRKL